MNDISLVFLNIEKAKQALKDLERDTDITWPGKKEEKPTEYKEWENHISEGFIEFRINQPDIFCSKPYLTYSTRKHVLRNFLKEKKGVMFLIK